MIRVKTYKMIFSLVLVLVLVVINIMPVLASVNNSIINPNEKISSSLSTKMNEMNADEYIPVYIWYQDINQNEVDSLTDKEIGYSKKEISQNIDMPNISMLYQARNNSILSDEIMNDYLEHTKSTRLIENNRTNEYINKHREISRNKYYEASKKLIDDYKLVNDKILFTSKYAPMITALLNQAQINELIKDQRVEEIGYEIDLPVEACSVDSVKHTMGQYELENNLNLTGLNVKVGLADVGYPSSDPELDLNSIVKIGNPSDSDHAKRSAIALVGNQSGFAKDVQLFASNYGRENIEEMIDRGVVLLCVSFGYRINEDNSSSDYAYNNYDKWIDHIVAQHHVTVVASAGNDAQGTYVTTNGIQHLVKRVLSPAMGRNVITVGAFDDCETYDPDDDILFSYSSYKNTNGTDITTGVEKPDVIIASNALNGGTSRSSPFLSAVIAQLFQLKPSLQVEPLAVKAIVLASCHRKAHYSTNGESQETMNSGIDGRENYESTSGITETQGAGIPNAWTMAAIVCQNTYFVGSTENSSVFSNIEQPPYGSTNMNVSLTWLSENCIADSSHNSYNLTVGNNTNMSLSIYQNDIKIISSDLLYSSTELCYFPLSENNSKYGIEIGTDNQLVEYAYAWSIDNPFVSASISNEGIYFLRNASNDSIYAKYMNNANNSYQQAQINSVTSQNSLVDSYKWIIKSSNSGCSICSGEGMYAKYLGISNVLNGTNYYSDMTSSEVNYTIINNNDGTKSVLDSNENMILSFDGLYLVWEEYTGNVFSNNQKWYFDKANYLVGDANADGIIDGSDSLFIQRVLAHMTSPTIIQFYLGDVNKSGNLDILDAYLIPNLYTY